MIHYTTCPICSAKNIVQKLSVKDYTVSQKKFDIWHCNDCSARFTQDVPDENEIGVYYQSENYISHSNTKKGFVNVLYHLVRGITLNKKKRLLINELSLQKGAVLDIGCGTGAFLNTMKTAGWIVTGVEPDPLAQKKAQDLYNIQPLSPEKLFDLPPASFHAITLWHVLEHVHLLQEYIKHLTTLLTPTGKIFIAVPNYTSADAEFYKEYWAAYDVPRHLYHFSPTAMEQLCNRNNLKISRVKPMWYDSFYASLLSEKYKNKGKGNFIKAFFTGLASNLQARKNTLKCSSIIYVVNK